VTGLFIVRHGETEWNLVERLQGRLDSPLTSRGIAQARAMGERLAMRIGSTATPRIVTSPIGRAAATAVVIAGCLGVDASSVEAEPLLSELDFGLWSGLTMAEVRHRYAEEYRARELDKWNRGPNGGESYSAAYERATRWLRAVRELPCVVGVTHEALSRVLRGAYAGLPRQWTLGSSHPHGTIYALRDGRVEAV